MRISDWSSDVCSSDLLALYEEVEPLQETALPLEHVLRILHLVLVLVDHYLDWHAIAPPGMDECVSRRALDPLPVPSALEPDLLQRVGTVARRPTQPQRRADRIRIRSVRTPRVRSHTAFPDVRAA